MSGYEPGLLVVDDEPQICAFFEKAGRQLGFKTRALHSPEAFVETLKSFRPIVVILDLMMPNCDGVELLRKMKDVGSTAHVMVVSGADPKMLEISQKLGRSHGLKMLGAMQKPIKLNVFQEKLRQVIDVTRAFSVHDVKRALSHSELEVHFQPQASLQSGIWTIDGAEALVRWRHPEFGLLMPGDFLSVIEENDLNGQLADFVLESSVRQLAAWRQAGLRLHISVNISARFFTDLDFPDRLKNMLARFEVPASMLGLELTETAAMSDATSAMDIFLRLRMTGVRLAIDDFGTGYSSLKQLYQLPFNELKIDRTFISGLPGDDEAQTIVRAIIGLAHSLNLTVCAEGVETQAALDYLSEFRCDRVQGFYISPAVPADEIGVLCRKWRSIRDSPERVSKS